MMEKINVNGPKTSLVYKYLKHHTQTSTITWNFATYFVVGPDGTTITAHNGVEPHTLFGHVMELLSSEEL